MRRRGNIDMRSISFFACVLAWGAVFAAVVWVSVYASAPVTLDVGRGDPVHALPVNGHLVFCSQTETRTSGELRPLFVDPAKSLVPPVRSIQCEIPGFEFQFCDLGIFGVSWVVTLPRFTPVLCIALAASACYWSRRRRLARVASDDSDPPASTEVS